MTDRSVILDYLKNHLKASRLQHTLGVEQTAICLAHRFGADQEKAACVALLHDAARYMEANEAIHLCEEAGIELDACTLAEPQILHAPAGAALAKNYFKETDTDIIEAVRYHTTGRAGMSLLEKIIYLADMIEPNRKPFDGLDEIRSAAEHDLDAAMIAAYNSSIAYIIKKHGIIHPETVFARNDLIQNKSKA